MSADHPPARDKRRVLALIPAYNESERIAPVVAGAREHLAVLVVDDGSTDETAAVAEAHGAEVLHQRPNQGKGAALRAGFRWALAAGYDAVITLDADGQHDPAEIPALIDAFAARDADLVIGERAYTEMPFPRNLSNTVGRWLFSWALGQRVQDNQSGYRLLSRRMMETTLDSEEEGFEFEVEMIVTCVQHGYRLAGVPIRTIYGDEPSHVQPVAQVIHFFRLVGKTWWNMRATRADQRPALARWWPLVALSALALIVALAIILGAGDDDGGDDTRAAATFPTPAPVTFIPPTPEPTTPPPTFAPPPEDVMDQPAPPFSLTTLDGDTVQLDALAGEIVFLNFWATWCVPCQNEMPLLQSLHEERGADGVRVLAVTNPDEGQTEAEVRAFLDDYALTLPVALVTDLALFGRFEVAGIPVTYIIDRAGVVRFRHLGELHDHDIEEYLAQLEA